MKNFSLCFRLVAIFTLTAIIVGGVVTFVSYKETSENIDEFFDTYQMTLGRQLAASDWGDTSTHTQKSTNKLIANIKNADSDDDAIGFAVFTTAGNMIFHDNENGRFFRFESNIGKFSNEKIKNDGKKWRIVRLKSVDGKFIIAVGQEIDYREDIAMDIVEEFLTPWLVGILVLLLSIVMLTFLEFRPLKKLTRNIEERSADDLSPINIQNIPNEISPLLEALNRMFLKIDNLLKRERSFISDSAHELRTPLTALKLQLEILQMAEDDAKMRNDAFEKLEKGLARSEHLVEQLLALSRLEANNNQYSNQEILDWKLIIENLIDEYKVFAKNKNISFAINFGDCVPFEYGNSLLVTLMIRNLIDNAIKYSPNGAVVSIGFNKDGLEVINSDTVVATELLEHLSERFFRPAGQKESGSGLGLAIVERIANIYNCKLIFSNTPKGFCVSIAIFDID